jgi:hypothetical protein
MKYVFASLPMMLTMLAVVAVALLGVLVASAGSALAVDGAPLDLKLACGVVGGAPVVGTLICS